MGAKVRDSEEHKLRFFLLGQRQERYIFRLDRMLLFNYFSNKELIKKIAVGGANFLFLTSRKEYYSAVRRNADACSQTALLWRPSAIGNLNTRAEVLEELYGEDFSYDSGFDICSKPNVFVLFDNEKFKSRKLIKETERFRGVPLFSVIDTDSIAKNTMFPIIGNDDSVLSIYFYSLFVAYCIVSGRKLLNTADYEKKGVSQE